VVNGKFLANNPAAAAAGTRALLKGAKWVETNPAAAARLSVEKKYLASNPELNTLAISHLSYIPSVSGGEAAVNSAAVEMKKAGMLNSTTDVPGLVKNAFVHLKGVSDEWLQTLQVDKVAGGQLPVDQDFRVAAELAITGKPLSVASCCSPGEK
jgi:NitT/TauT family transport system substrate-binding protein